MVLLRLPALLTKGALCRCSGSCKVFVTSESKVYCCGERRLTVHVTCTEVELSTTGLCMVTTTSPNSFCTRRWSTPWAVGLMSVEQRQKCSAVICEGKKRKKKWCCCNPCGFSVTPLLCTLRAHRLRHRAGVPEPLSVDRPDNEQVDRVGSQVPNCELSGLDVVCHRLPAVAHGLTVEVKTQRERERKKEGKRGREKESQPVLCIFFTPDLSRSILHTGFSQLVAAFHVILPV